MIRADRALDKYLSRTATRSEKEIIEKILSGFRKHEKKRESRDTRQFIEKSAITYNDQTCGIASEITYQCNATCGSSIPLAQSSNRKSYTKHNNHLSILGILLTFDLVEPGDIIRGVNNPPIYNTNKDNPSNYYKQYALNMKNLP